MCIRDSYGIDFPPPFMPSQLGLQASLQQYWFLTAAGQATGPNNLPLLPTSFVRNHPGPAEVILQVLSYDSTRSPERLLASRLFTDESIIESAGMTAVTHIHSPANDGWMVVHPNNYRDNGDMDEYFLQGALGDRLIQITVWGFHLTLDEARGLANATTGSG